MVTTDFNVIAECVCVGVNKQSHEVWPTLREI